MTGGTNISFGDQAQYEIKALGRSGTMPDDLFRNLNLELTQISENKFKYTLNGILRDQAELAGILNTLYEMHMVVLSVHCLEADQDRSKT